MKLDDTKKRVDILVPCACGAEILRIEQYLDAYDKSVDISSYYMEWYNVQTSWWNIITRRLGIIWCVLRGKEYGFYGVMLTTKKQVVDFKKAVAELDEDLPF